MKAHSYVFLCLVFCIPQLGRAARFEDALHGLDYSFVQNRCSLGDQLNTSAEAKARIEWALRCDIIPKKKHFSLTKEFTEDGQVIDSEWARYPTFAFNQPGYPVWMPNLGSCDMPSNVFWYSVCRSGCYQADQAVRFATGDIEIAQALQNEGESIVTAERHATLESPAYTTTPVDYFTMDQVPQVQTIIALATQFGSTLKVTPNHPVLRSDGVMLAASSFHVGDALLRADGSPEKIVRISTSDLFTQVYNVAPKQAPTASDLVVAQGYINGSARYQNEYDHYLGSVVLRSCVPADVLP